MMGKYTKILLNEMEARLTSALWLHVRDMFPTAQPGGHDWQHIGSQMELWEHVGGSVMRESQFAYGFDPLLPFLYIPGHDLNRLPIFEDKAPTFFKKKTDGLQGAAFEEAETHNAKLKTFNRRAEERMVAMYDGLLRKLGVSTDLRRRVSELMVEIGGPNKPEDPADLIVCSDLDKCITGPFYAWRCAAVGVGQRVRHVTKRYLIAKPSELGGHLVADEELDSWTDDLEWAFGEKGWDPCTATDQSFVIRSAVLHEIADPGFEQLRRLKAETLAQLELIGYHG